jgi:hypothetical protein
MGLAVQIGNCRPPSRVWQMVNHHHINISVAFYIVCNCSKLIPAWNPIYISLKTNWRHLPQMIQNGVFQAGFKVNLYYFSSLRQEIGLLPVMLHSLFVSKSGLKVPWLLHHCTLISLFVKTPNSASFERGMKDGRGPGGTRLYDAVMKTLKFWSFEVLDRRGQELVYRRGLLPGALHRWHG